MTHKVVFPGQAGEAVADALPLPVVTEEMIRRGCEVVQAFGGIPFNPHFGPETHSAVVREILEVSLGLREPDE